MKSKNFDIAREIASIPLIIFENNSTVNRDSVHLNAQKPNDIPNNTKKRTWPLAVNNKKQYVHRAANSQKIISVTNTATAFLNFVKCSALNTS